MKPLKNASVLLLLFLFNPLSVYCQYNLTIEIAPLKNDRGQIILAFMDENEDILKQLTAGIEGEICRFTIDSLEQGKYAFKYIHDENKNHKLDTKLFIIPKEGYGFSNNAKGKFGPPAFKDTVFELTGSDTLICEPNY